MKHLVRKVYVRGVAVAILFRTLWGWIGCVGGLVKWEKVVAYIYLSVL